MRGLVLVAAAVFALAASAYWLWWGNAQAPSPAEPIADLPALLGGLGSYSRPVSTTSADAQRWFDQGLVLAYGFNHGAAADAFLRATEFDPGCAMCWWGAALVLGPHLNAGMDPANVPLAWERVQKARAAAMAGKSDVERAFAEALASRYGADPPPDRHPLDLAYARAMRDLISRFPYDLDARTLFAESVMDLHPWDFYEPSGAPRSWTPEIVTVLEKVLQEEPGHPGANHLYIHAVEASTTPERGLDAARRLESIAPAAGHLVHMSSHIYFRTGRYHEASEANVRALAADAAWMAACRPGPGIYPDGYIPHHELFLFESALMEGASARALSAAAEAANRLDLDQSRVPGYAALQHDWMAPYFARLRFGRWDEILAEPSPPADLAYPTALWHFARGVADARQGQVEDAQQEFGMLVTASGDPSLASATIWDLNPLSDLLLIARSNLAGEIAAARRDWPAAVAALQAAIAIEDRLRFDEPPEWPIPVRETLGAVLLDAGRAAEAQAVYLEDLRRYPENGWSLAGLVAALRAQGKSAEADEAEKRRAAAWQNADVTIATSRM